MFFKQYVIQYVLQMMLPVGKNIFEKLRRNHRTETRDRSEFMELDPVSRAAVSLSRPWRFEQKLKGKNAKTHT